MNVAMMQPSFIPWQGYFELIMRSDVFIFLDDFQFSVQSYNQRNRLFVNKGQVDWYTSPVKKSVSFQRPLNQTVMDRSPVWRMKMWRRIEANYAKAEFFKAISPSIRECLLSDHESLAAQNMAFIKWICDFLGCKTEFRLSSAHPVSAKRSARVLELLRWCSADRYYCAKGSFGYMQEDAVFPVSDIEVLFQDFKPVPYKQVGAMGTFVPALSVLDALMNVGPHWTAELIGQGTQKWLTWEEMAHEKRTSDEYCGTADWRE